MHNHMGIGQNFVDFFNHVNCENIAGRFAGELISAVRGADGNRQSVNMRFFNESFGFFGVGNQTLFINRAFGAVTVFLVAFTGFQRTDNAEFAFNRSTDRMSAGNDFFGNFDVIFIRRRGFAVSFQRAVHHYRRIAVNDCRLADIDRGAVILVQTNRQFGEHFNSGGNHVTNHRVAGKFAGAGRGLNDNRGIDFSGSLQNGKHLFHIIDVKCGNAVIIFGGMVKNLTHCN